MRKFRIEINGKAFIKELPDTDGSGRTFRVVFHTETRYTYALSLLDLRIYNLSSDTLLEATTLKKDSQITLYAGYDDNFLPIFTGNICAVLNEREGTELVTHILAKSSYAERRKNVSISLGMKTAPTAAIKAVVAQSGRKIKIDESQFKDIKTTSKFICNGDWTEALNKLGSMYDFNWNDNGEYINIDRPQYARSGAPIEVNMCTGLISYPQASSDNADIFAEFSVRLNPSLELGNKINLRSKYATFNTSNMYFKSPENTSGLNGQYKVVEIAHDGDSWGDKWQTKVKAQTTRF